MEQTGSIGSALHRKDRRSEDLERWASLATATAVTAFGLSRRSVPGVCLALAATPLADRGLAGSWRQLENLPQFTTNLEQVADLRNGRSHWIARGPAGMGVAWDVEIINEVPNSVIGLNARDAIVKVTATAICGSERTSSPTPPSHSRVSPRKWRSNLKWLMEHYTMRFSTNFGIATTLRSN